MKSNKKELNRMNFMIIGSGGVGKSTLINELFGEKLAEEGSGKRCTAIGKKYISKKLPFLTLYDSVGTEIGEGHTLSQVQKETLEEITKNLNINDPNEHIHCIVYCTSSNRIFQDELKVILKIREKYDGKKLPIVIVYTRALDENDIKAKKEAINDFLKEYGETISDDIFGITFIKLHAKEYFYERFGQKMCDPCFGLADLISTCYKKGEKSYKIAIKDSLIEIGKNSFYRYIKKTCESLVNNINFFFYLSQNFEPNFSNFISYTFERITDIENQEGLDKNELNQLEILVQDKFPNNEENSYHNNSQGKKNNGPQLEKVECIFCRKAPVNPFTCKKCEAKSCEQCYLAQFEYRDIVKCLLCGGNDFTMEIENSKSENKIVKIDNINNFNYNINIENDYISNLNVLKNNLNFQSKHYIDDFIEKFKNEMISVVNEKFEEFTNKAVKKIYYDVLEKYNLNSSTQNINMNEALEKKEVMMAKASNTIKSQLKKKSEENFLKKYSSCLFQDIIKIFEIEIVNKVKQYINNITNNKDIINFFESNEIINNNEELAIKQKFEEYIQKLRKKEADSQEKAIKIQYGIPMNETKGNSKDEYEGKGDSYY